MIEYFASNALSFVLNTQKISLTMQDYNDDVSSSNIKYGILVGAAKQHWTTTVLPIPSLCKKTIF